MPAQHELSITRFIDAPPETVYRVYTERTGEYWCPKPWTTPVVDWDLRAGGRANTVMRSKDDRLALEQIFVVRRPRGFLRKFQLCRICFREMAHNGEIPGVTKASW